MIDYDSTDLGRLVSYSWMMQKLPVTWDYWIKLLL